METSFGVTVTGEQMGKASSRARMRWNFFLAAGLASAHQPELVYLQSGEVQIINPEVSRALYDELKGGPRYYLIDSAKDFAASTA